MWSVILADLIREEKFKKKSASCFSQSEMYR